jgi:hypothetical protein
MEIGKPIEELIIAPKELPLPAPIPSMPSPVRQPELIPA